MTLDDFQTILEEFIQSDSSMMNVWRKNGYHSVISKDNEKLEIIGQNLLISPRKGLGEKIYTAIDAIECISFVEHE